MEQTKNAATAVKDTSLKVQELAALSKRLDLLKERVFTGASRCRRKPRMVRRGLWVLYGVHAG